MSTDAARADRFHLIAEEVFEPLQRYLRRRATSHDAEDVLSEVLLTVWRRIDDVPAEGALPWCYGVARRTLANQRRGRNRNLRLLDKVSGEPMRLHPDPADLQPDPVLADALAQLDQADQEVLRLWAWEQLEPREIAVVLAISPNAATLRLSRAKKKLSRILTRQDAELAGHRAGKGTEEHPDD